MDTSKDTSWLAEDLRIGKLLLAGELKECKHHLSALTTGSDFVSSYIISIITLIYLQLPICKHLSKITSPPL